MDTRVYEYHNPTDEMFFVDSHQQRIPVVGRQFEGQGLKKNEVVKHLQSLRGLAYSVLHSIIIGNAKLGQALVENVCPLLTLVLTNEI